MQENADDEYLIEQFTLNPATQAEIVELIKEAFLHGGEEGGTIAFTEQTLDLFYKAPNVTPDMFVRAIHKPSGKLVGFVGGIPRPLAIRGKVYKCGIPGSLSVHGQHQRKGLALKMGLKMLEIGKQKGYDGGFAIFEVGEHGIDTAKALIRETGLTMREVLRINKFVIRVFDVKKVASVVKLKGYEKLALRLLQGTGEVHNPRVRAFRPGDAERLFGLMQDHVKRNELSIVREHDEFVWYVQHPSVNVVVHEGKDGQVDGFLLAWEFQLAGFGHAVPFGFLDLVHTYRLSFQDTVDLARFLCVTSKARGWAGLQSPYIPYFDPKPFKKARFIFFGKSLIISMFPLVPMEIPDPVTSFYFDWR